MVGVGDTGVVDTLEVRLEDARRCHETNEYGPNLPLAVIEAGIRPVWAEEHPPRPASPRPVNDEGGVDVGVNAGGDQVGSSAGGTLSRQQGVIYAGEVGGVQAQCSRRRLQARATSEVDEAQGGRPGQRWQFGGGCSSGGRSTKDTDKQKSAKDGGRGGGSRRRECWICRSPDHLSFECPDRTSSSPSSAPHAPPLVADLRGLTLVSASGNDGRSRASPVAPAKSIAGGRLNAHSVGVGSTREKQVEVQPTLVKPAKEASAGHQSIGERAAVKPTTAKLYHSSQPEFGGRLTSTYRLTFTTAYDKVDDDLLYDDAEEDEELPELDPDMHADPEHRWDILTMTVKGGIGELEWQRGEGRHGGGDPQSHQHENLGAGRTPTGGEHPEELVGVDDTVKCEKARMVVKGFTQVYGADYDETYAPVRSYVTLRIFLSIVAVLNLNLMQLNIKNTFLQSKLDRVLYMYQPD
ncbi:unnamed protein product [Closterium sp. NIES-53]